jgi:hypothetical protein
VRYEHAEMVPNVVGSREGREQYIVTDGVMVGIYPGIYFPKSFFEGCQHSIRPFVLVTVDEKYEALL